MVTAGVLLRNTTYLDRIQAAGVKIQLLPGPSPQQLERMDAHQEAVEQRKKEKEAAEEEGS